MRVSRSVKISYIIVLISFIVVILTLIPRDASGHGKMEEITRKNIGPYEIVVAIVPNPPAVGMVHFSVTPLLKSSGDLVNDAEIILVAYDKSGDAIYQSRAVNLPNSPHLYDANIKFRSPGIWRIEIQVAGDDLEPINFPLHLTIYQQAIAPNPVGGIVLLTVVFILIGGAYYLWRSSKNKNRKPSC